MANLLVLVKLAGRFAGSMLLLLVALGCESEPVEIEMTVPAFSGVITHPPSELDGAPYNDVVVFFTPTGYWQEGDVWQLHGSHTVVDTHKTRWTKVDEKGQFSFSEKKYPHRKGADFRLHMEFVRPGIGERGTGVHQFAAIQRGELQYWHVGEEDWSRVVRPDDPREMCTGALDDEACMYVCTLHWGDDPLCDELRGLLK